MNASSYLTLAVLAVATVAFGTGRWRPDAIAVLALLALLVFGIVDPRTAFAGFGSPVLVAVASVYLVSAGLERTGVAITLGRRILRLAGGRESFLILVFAGVGGVLSGVMNSIGAMAVLLPAAMAAAKEARISPSKLLLPLALGTRLGGSLTLIAAPTNLIAAETLDTNGLRPFGFFEVSPIGIAFLVAGVAFMALLGRRWLPATVPAEPITGKALTDIYRLRERLFEIRINRDSPLAGKTLEQSELGAAGVTVLSILHSRRRVVAPRPTDRLHAGDLLLVQGRLDELAASRLLDGAEVREKDKIEAGVLESPEVRVAEIMLAPRSSLFGKTLREVDFREKYGVTVLAIWREGRSIRTRLVDLPVQLGDALLVQGRGDRMRVLGRDPDFLVLGPEEATPLRTDRRGWAIAAVLLMIALSVGGVEIAVAALIAAALVVGAGCINAEEIYRFVEWRVLVFIGAMLPMSSALNITGGTAQIVSGILSSIGHTPLVTLGALLAIGIAANQVMPSVAATVIMAPIALQIASATGSSPHALMMAVIAAAGTTFTPISNPVNLLIMGPGGYRMKDYVRIGLPLALLLWLVGLIVIPIIGRLR
ncbi:MAG: SLC13 family permease [bacterium]